MLVFIFENEKWIDFGYIFMVELKSFFGRLGVVRERKREIKNVFKDLSNWVEKMLGEKSKIVED